MIKRTEKEIMQQWQGDEIMVSVTCVAFNHEYCIAETMDSFLMQDTNFPFEILINDDASTDRTAEILKEYQSAYPNIVKPVLQTENQFSQHINTMAILYPLIKGKYVAFCDGDDYWTDNQKLQIQVDGLEKKPELDLCFHYAHTLVNNKKVGIFAKHAENDTIINIQEVILGDGVFCPTASLLFTNRLISSLPAWFDTAIPGDYVAQIMGAANGGALYINRCMSVYRTGEVSSWTESETLKNSQKRKQSLDNLVEQLTFINEQLNFKYDDEIETVILENRTDFIRTRTIEKSVKNEVFQENKETFSIMTIVLWHLLFKHTKLLDTLKGMVEMKNEVLSRSK